MGIISKELLKAFMLIFIAEMGDKTQILAMAFATRYPVKKVLLGIFIGAFINHGLAVLLGNYLSAFVPINTVQLIAGAAFIGFSLWTLKPEEEKAEDEKKASRLGPVATVAAAFFIGELGDKTQLTAITLAADAAHPAAVLGGTVLGMIVTGGIGIFIGKKLGDRIPELAIKLIASAVFMFFGIAKLYSSVPSQYLTPINILAFLVIMTVSAAMLIRSMLIMRRSGMESAYIKQSRELHEYYKRIREDINNICLGTEKCGRCEGNQCIVGYTKNLIKYCLDDKANAGEPFEVDFTNTKKSFSREQAIDSLIITLQVLRPDPNREGLRNVNEIRKSLELIVFGRSIEKIITWAEYERSLLDIDEAIAASIISDLKQEK